MTDAELLAKIKAEIKGRINSYSIVNDKELWIVQTYMSVLSFLDTLESEKPSERLEEEIKRWWDEEYMKNSVGLPILPIVQGIARHFAQWGAEHLKK